MNKLHSIAVDFGSVCTDIAFVNEKNTIYRYALLESKKIKGSLDAVFSALSIHPKALSKIIVTGGKSESLASTYQRVPVEKINELIALGYGALSVSKQKAAIVCNVGATTSIIYIYPEEGNTVVQYLGGTGFGGATIAGLGRLLLKTADYSTIDALARKGNQKRVHITVGETVGGSYGPLSPSTTAAYFAKVTDKLKPAPADIAQGLISMVGETVVNTAVIFARQARLKKLVMVGRSTTLSSLRSAMTARAGQYGCRLLFPERNEYATVIGAVKVSQIYEHA